MEVQQGSAINSVTRSALHFVIHFDVVRKRNSLDTDNGMNTIVSNYGAP